MENNQSISMNSSNKKNDQTEVEKVLSHWLTLQKIIKEEITLNEIISNQQETYKSDLNNYYIKYYDQKIRTRETLENVIHIDNSRPIKYFKLVKQADTVLKDAIDPIQNLFILMRSNVDLILKLVSIIDERETGKELDINTIVDLFCHQFYENLLIPNPEQEDLLMLIYLLLEREISNMNSASVASFIDDNSTFVGKFLRSYTKKQELKTYLSMTLGKLLLTIENSSDNCLDLNPTRIKTVLSKTAYGFEMENLIEHDNLGNYLTKHIKKSSININKPSRDEDEEEDNLNDDNEKEEGSALQLSSKNKGKEDDKGSEENEDKNQKTIESNIHKKKKQSLVDYNNNYSIDINQDELNSKIQKETDQDLRDFYLRQLERINKDPDTFTNKKLYF